MPEVLLGRYAQAVDELPELIVRAWVVSQSIGPAGLE